MFEVPRVLLVTDALEIGGVEKVVVNLANSLSEMGIEVAVGARSGGPLWGKLLDSVEEHFGAIDGLPVFGHIRYAIWIRRVVKRHRFHLVHAHQRAVSLMAKIGLLGTGVPVIEHVHSHFSPRSIRRFFSFRGDVLIGCSRSIERMLVDDFGRNSATVRVITNSVEDLGAHGFDLPDISGPVAARVMAVGRLSPVKDPLRFVGVVNALVARGCPVEGEWVGDGPLRAESECEVARTAAPVLLSGHSDDVPGKLRSAHLLLLTSQFEGMPLVVLEAMSLGRVVVAPRVGGLAELVVEGVTGVLYDADADNDEIATRIAALVDDPAAFADMGRRARERFVEIADMRSMVQSVREVYGQALEMSGGRSA